MKLRNKKTGEIGELRHIIDNEISWFEVKTKTFAYVYNTLAELNEEWQDYEEEQYYWLIDCEGTVIKDSYYPDCPSEYELNIKQIGNFFETKEEAEKAVEKLKAWQRLKDSGFRFEGWKRDKKYCGDLYIEATDQISCNDKDLDLLFGGE